MLNCGHIFVFIDNFGIKHTGYFICFASCIKFYSQNTNILPPKPKSTFRHLKQGIQDFHRMYVLVPADKAANNVVVF